MSKAEEIKYLLKVSRRMKFDKTWPITEDEVIEFISSSFEFGFVCGALWQKQQDQSTIELAEEHAILAGMEKMKEEMMAKAIDGDITFDYYGDGDKTYGCIAHDSFCLEDFGLKDRDKVKMILIKEG